MFVLYLFQVRFRWISRSSWFPTRSVPFSIHSLSAYASGAFIPGVTAVQCHSPRAVIPLYHPTPSNSRNARCTRAMHKCEEQMRDKGFLFPFFTFLYDSCRFSTFARCWSVFYIHFCLYFTTSRKFFGTKEILSSCFYGSLSSKALRK